MNAFTRKQAEQFEAASQTEFGDRLVTFLDDGCMVTEELDTLVIDLEDIQPSGYFH